MALGGFEKICEERNFLELYVENFIIHSSYKLFHFLERFFAIIIQLHLLDFPPVASHWLAEWQRT